MIPPHEFPPEYNLMTRPEEPIHKISGKHLGESAKAVRFEIHQINGRDTTFTDNFGDPIRKTEWFPFSQVKSISTQAPSSDELDEIQVKEWILKQKGLL